LEAANSSDAGGPDPTTFYKSSSSKKIITPSGVHVRGRAATATKLKETELAASLSRDEGAQAWISAKAEEKDEEGKVRQHLLQYKNCSKLFAQHLTNKPTTSAAPSHNYHRTGVRNLNKDPQRMVTSKYVEPIRSAHTTQRSYNAAHAAQPYIFELF
jgi:hypothetical protein